MHEQSGYRVIRVEGDKREILEDQKKGEQLSGVILYDRGDYIGMFSGEYLLLSGGFIISNQVYYDAEEAIDHPRAMKDIKKRIRHIHYKNFTQMGSMLFDIIKFQASTEGFQGAGKLWGIQGKLKVIR